MFGPDVSLDIIGSFHASTADYLKLEDNDRLFPKPLVGVVLSRIMSISPSASC